MGLELPLPGGTTDQHLDDELAKTWLGLVHRWAREQHAEVLSPLKLIQAGDNFYAVEVEAAGRRIELRLHVGLRLIGGAEAQRAIGVRELKVPFVDVPGSQYYAASGFAVAGAAELERSAEPRDLALLSKRERSEATHLGADRIGDLIFNWFD